MSFSDITVVFGHHFVVFGHVVFGHVVFGHACRFRTCMSLSDMSFSDIVQRVFCTNYRQGNPLLDCTLFKFWLRRELACVLTLYENNSWHRPMCPLLASWQRGAAPFDFFHPWNLVRPRSEKQSQWRRRHQLLVQLVIGQSYRCHLGFSG